MNRAFLLMAGGWWLAAAGVVAADRVGGEGVAARAGGTAEQAEGPAFVAYDAHGKRDPFAALVRDGRFVGGSAGAFSGDASSLSLAGIMWDERGRSIALINDTEVRIGDVVAGYEVTEMTRSTVTLRGQGRTITLQVSFEGADHRREHP